MSLLRRLISSVPIVQRGQFSVGRQLATTNEKSANGDDADGAAKKIATQQQSIFLSSELIPRISLCEEHDTIVAIHPEPAFPYEHSIPITDEDLAIDKRRLFRLTPELEVAPSDDSKQLSATSGDVLRSDHVGRWRQRYGPKGPPNWVIRKAFYLDRSVFYSRYRKNRRMFPWGKPTPEREAL